MSFLGKIRQADQLFKKSAINTCTIAYYSRRSNSKNADSSYKVVKSKVRLEDEADYVNSEGGPNWELFAPRGNRFYLPGLLGPAWQGSSTIQIVDVDLDGLIDFEKQESSKLQVSSKACPVLIRNNLHELFPSPEVFNKGAITMITLSHNKVHSEIEQSAKNFVLAAREICARLRLSGYWADFMNPFSGRPFYSYSSGRNLYKVDQRFRGIDIKIENLNDCLIISSDQNVGFSGSVFTNAPTDLSILKGIIKT